MNLQIYGVCDGTSPPFCTSASGAMVDAPKKAHLFLRVILPCDGTVASLPSSEVWEQAFVFMPQTTAGTAFAKRTVEPQGTNSAIMELRRLSGLTWEQLANLFGVTRRTLHFWASGEPVNAPNEERLRRVLAAVRKTDRGFAAKNRAMLLEDREGVIPLDLLARDEFDSFIDLVGVGPGRRELKLKPLSPEAWEARKPQPPEELVDALQDRVHFDVGKARPGIAVKIKRRPS